MYIAQLVLVALDAICAFKVFFKKLVSYSATLAYHQGLELLLRIFTLALSHIDPKTTAFPNEI